MEPAPSNGGQGDQPLPQDRFFGAQIVAQQDGNSATFDANQYSFFGDMDGLGGLEDPDALAGALEDGLDAPPEEEEPGGFGVLGGLEEDELFNDRDLIMHNEEDLSLASMFRNKLQGLADDDDVEVMESEMSGSVPSGLLEDNQLTRATQLAPGPASPTQFSFQQPPAPADSPLAALFPPASGHSQSPAETRLHTSPPAAFPSQFNNGTDYTTLAGLALEHRTQSGNMAPVSLNFSQAQGFGGPQAPQGSALSPGYAMPMNTHTKGPITAEQLEAQMFNQMETAPTPPGAPPPGFSPYGPAGGMPIQMSQGGPPTPGYMQPHPGAMQQPPHMMSPQHASPYGMALQHDAQLGMSPQHPLQHGAPPQHNPQHGPMYGPPHGMHPQPPPPGAFEHGMMRPVGPGGFEHHMMRPPPGYFPPQGYGSPGYPRGPMQQQPPGSHYNMGPMGPLMHPGGGPFQPRPPGMMAPGPPRHPPPGQGQWASGPPGGRLAPQHNANSNHRENGHQDQNYSQASPSRQRPGAKLMTGDEIDHIMRIMHLAVASGAPYCEDYCYQAYINKHKGARNKADFAPHELRDFNGELARLDPSAKVRFVDVQGLGKLVYSNIRTPKVLMDLTVGAKDQDVAPGDATLADKPARPLEQEPLLAARIMVEDCMHLLLDVDDIDRTFASAEASGRPTGLPADAETLRQRRALLMSGITNSFRLPATPQGAVSAADPSALGDGVFLRIMALPKGRVLLARTLGLLVPSVAAAAATLAPASPAVSPGDEPSNPFQLLWATLRNAWHLFGASLQSVEGSSEKPMFEATAKLASSLRSVLLRVTTSQELTDALTAVIAGCERHVASITNPTSPMDTCVLPLALTRQVAQLGPVSEWLGEVLAGLLTRGEQLGLHRDTASEAWRQSFQQLYEVLAKHLQALQMIHGAAVAGQNAEALGVVKALTCKALVQAMMPHASDAQRTHLRDTMMKFLSS